MARLGEIPSSRTLRAEGPKRRAPKLVEAARTLLGERVSTDIVRLRGPGEGGRDDGPAPFDVTVIRRCCEKVASSGDIFRGGNGSGMTTGSSGKAFREAREVATLEAEYTGEGLTREVAPEAVEVVRVDETECLLVGVSSMGSSFSY